MTYCKLPPKVNGSHPKSVYVTYLFCFRVVSPLVSRDLLSFVLIEQFINYTYNFTFAVLVSILHVNLYEKKVYFRLFNRILQFGTV